MMPDEYPVAQEVEEEHGLLDSYMSENVPEGSTTVELQQDELAMEGQEYAFQVNEETRGHEVLVEGEEHMNTEATPRVEEHVYQTYEVLADGTVGNVVTEQIEQSQQTTPLIGEQKINPEFEQFLEQFTTLLKQLHQVSNPENILQACMVLQQLKVIHDCS